MVQDKNLFMLHLVNNMAAKDMTVQGAMASAAMI